MSFPGSLSNPIPPQSAENAVSVVAGWGQAKQTFFLELPSGSGRVHMKELEVPEIIELGIMDNLDSFSGKLLPETPSTSTPVEGEPKPGRDMAKMIDVIDRAISACVIEPTVVYVAENARENLASDGTIYAHLVPLGDKMEIFNRGFKSMMQFLKPGGEQAAGVGNLAQVTGNPSAS